MIHCFGYLLTCSIVYFLKIQFQNIVLATDYIENRRVVWVRPTINGQCRIWACCPVNPRFNLKVVEGFKGLRQGINQHIKNIATKCLFNLGLVS